MTIFYRIFDSIISYILVLMFSINKVYENKKNSWPDEIRGPVRPVLACSKYGIASRIASRTRELERRKSRRSRFATEIHA